MECNVANIINSPHMPIIYINKYKVRKQLMLIVINIHNSNYTQLKI